MTTQTFIAMLDKWVRHHEEWSEHLFNVGRMVDAEQHARYAKQFRRCRDWAAKTYEHAEQDSQERLATLTLGVRELAARWMRDDGYKKPGEFWYGWNEGKLNCRAELLDLLEHVESANDK